MKNIKIIATGGTISAKGRDRIDTKDYVSGHYTAEDFIELIPEIKDIANVETTQLENFSSTRIQTSHWITLRNMINKTLNEEQFDGVVVTHGTNTIEETAYFLHLTVNSDKPVVCVGAQRPFTAMGTDAGINLLNAVRVAESDKSIGKGVLVFANDEINSAREVSKTSTYRLETFQSGKLGFLGYVDPDQSVQYYRSPTKKHTNNSFFAKENLSELKNVEILYSYAGSNGDLIDFVTRSGQYEGIVMAGTGAGRCSLEEDLALTNAVEKGLVVVRSSRVGDDRVVPIENFDRFPCVTADNLSPQKARILLMLALSVTSEISNIQEYFSEY